MKIFHKLFYCSVLLISPVTTSACTCIAETAPATDWVKEMAEGSTYIFYGTVERIGVDDSIKVRIAKQVKGKSGGLVKPPLDCQDFTIERADNRVFFVSEDGYIRGCSDYKDFLTDLGMLKELRNVLKRGT